MRPDVTEVDRQLLATWPLPEPDGSKLSRGDVLVIGGARRSPGGVLLAGLSALRVGAGRLSVAVASSVAPTMGVAVPEGGVLALEETSDGHVRGRSVRAYASDIRGADALLVGPGLDDIREARRMLSALSGMPGDQCTVVLDAYALGALSGRRPRHVFPNAVLKPNESEAAVLLGRELDDLVDDTAELAERYSAVVTCMGVIADPAGAVYQVPQAGPGLGTSGSGDVLAGAIAGLAARGCPPPQAAVWGTYLHARAGESLAHSVAPVGYLARDISERLPFELGAVTSQ
jgi:hydroxyethylthiazole kinase-like uncharacterized protein yjeF